MAAEVLTLQKVLPCWDAGVGLDGWVSCVVAME
jgi:hypothetical protein